MGDQHAGVDRARRGYSDRAVRQLACRPDEDDLPPRVGIALWPDDAGHLRRSFQLLLSAAVLGSLRGRIPGARPRHTIRVGSLFRPAAQLPALWLDRVVSVWRLAGRLQVLSQGP